MWQYDAKFQLVSEMTRDPQMVRKTKGFKFATYSCRLKRKENVARRFGGYLFYSVISITLHRPHWCLLCPGASRNVTYQMSSSSSSWSLPLPPPPSSLSSPSISPWHQKQSQLGPFHPTCLYPNRLQSPIILLHCAIGCIGPYNLQSLNVNFVPTEIRSIAEKIWQSYINKNIKRHRSWK